MAGSSLVLVYVHTTSSPGSTLNVAVAPSLVDGVAESPSSHVMPVSFQCAWACSVNEYVPGETSCASEVVPDCRLSMFVTPSDVVWKSNVPSPPSVIFLIATEPRLTLVNVQTTCSPGSTLN